ncbi:dihydrofolate reductase family protein [Nocardiopsis sp. CT-R113]|uniref:Dihydrofolate reductase family protein n=1 Tax=Nocardiopsis codii TaxID=3065942 RepID=A0ABU7KHR9_9ACTN|nr:dihydrofolate reductase family protein [Nocardiopsis sp. CT-R113]MEE2041785.1 dihydrofolate reductase family protein [Nocardiopsis sp. CT-R113]
MTRTIYNTATSLDGFIATDDHSLEWLFAADPGEANDEHAEFMRNVGALVSGAHTYEWILRHEGDRPWPYDVPAWVLTHRDLPRVEGDIRFVSADTDQELRDLHAQMVEAADGRDVWVVGGGEIAGRLAELGLLDEVIVSVAPVTLGSGAPLLARRVDLRVLDVHRAQDFACARYEVVRP